VRWLAGVILLAAGLRFGTLDAKGFWGDEISTVSLVHMPYPDMLAGIARLESTPPLYYSLAWLWAKLFGTTEVGLRSLSAVLGVATVPVAYLAAREFVSRRAALMAATLVAEGANGPTSVEADAILTDRGILVLPDVLTNAGGVTVSYFEWVQDLGRLFWTRNEIRARLAEKLGDAFDRVWELAHDGGMTLRSAALVGGIREVAGALEARGIYP